MKIYHGRAKYHRLLNCDSTLCKSRDLQRNYYVKSHRTFRDDNRPYKWSHSRSARIVVDVKKYNYWRSYIFRALEPLGSPNHLCCQLVGDTTVVGFQELAYSVGYITRSVSKHQVAQICEICIHY